MCIDLLNNNVTLSEISLNGNSLGNEFCESLAELIKSNPRVQKVDLSCNYIDDYSVLKDSLKSCPNIIEIDVRNNKFSEAVEGEIHEIVTKNFLASKKITTETFDKELMTRKDKQVEEEVAKPGDASPAKSEKRK